MNSTSFSIWCHAHDLLDEGPAETLTRLEATGLNTLGVAASYHAGRFLSPHNPKRKVVPLEGGVVYFRPKVERYPQQLKPVPSSLCTDMDPFSVISSVASRHGFRMHAWLVCLHNSRLGASQPSLTIENAFGDRYLHGLCPSQSAVRDFVVALSCDAARYPVQALDLEALAFMGYEHAYHHEKRGFATTRLDAFLLSLCFCPSCRSVFAQRGIDVDGCSMKVGAYIEKRFAGKVQAPPIDNDAQLLDAFQEVLGDEGLEILYARENKIITLTQAVRAAVRPDVELVLRTSFSPFFTGGKSALRPQAARKSEVPLMFTFFGANPDRIGPAAQEIQRECGSQRLHAGIMACAPDTENGPQLLDRYRALGQGWDGIHFYHYGLMPLTGLDWIAEALRDSQG
jgi:hypothetical protein